MIDPQDIHTPHLGDHAIAPELEVIPLHHIPVVERIAPELPQGGEVIRRHTRNRGGVPGGVQLKLLPMSPGLSRVWRDIER